MAELKAVEQFQLESVEEPESDRSEAATKILVVALKALSQRALVALSACFTLLTVASAFALWWRVLPEPSILQLIGLGIYAIFVLSVHLVRR
jgi:hypothetical protein